MQVLPIPTAEQYLNTRKGDYLALSHEIGQARKGAVVDLGYCTIVDNLVVHHRYGQEACKSFAEALAFILRRFW